MSYVRIELNYTTGMYDGQNTITIVVRITLVGKVQEVTCG